MLETLLKSSRMHYEHGYTIDGTPYVRIYSEDYHDTIHRARKLGSGFLFLAVIEWKKYFEIQVFLYKPNKGVGLISTLIPVNEPVIDTITDIYPAAYLYENEAFEMYGIRFLGNEKLRRLFTNPEDGYPFRKNHVLPETPPGGWIAGEKSPD